jgi:hypothetical protein
LWNAFATTKHCCEGCELQSFYNVVMDYLLLFCMYLRTSQHDVVDTLACPLL